MDQEKNIDKVQIDIGMLFNALLHNAISIVIFALIGGILALSITMFLIKPTYRSSLTVFVNNRNATDEAQSLGSGDVTAARSLTYTYAAIMKSRPVLEDALKMTGLDSKYTYEAVSGHISTSIEDNTQLVNLYVTMQQPEEAYKIADAIADISPDYVANIVEGSSMKVVTNPIIPAHAYSPNAKKNMLTGITLGVLLMCAYIVVKTLTDNRVKNEADLEAAFGISIIGTIPNIDTASTGKYGANYGNKKGAAR